MTAATLTRADTALDTGRWPMEDRLDGPVLIDQTQAQLDRYCEYLERLADGAVGGRFKKGQELLEHRWGVAIAAAGTNPLTGKALYSIDDFRLWWRRAEEMGGTITSPGPVIVGRLFRGEIVPNALLRARVTEKLVGSNHINDEGSMTLDTIASAADLVEGTYVSRLLGNALYPTQSGRPSLVKWYMKYTQAAAIARAVGVPFQEVGL